MNLIKKLTPELLDFWVDNRLNVLFEGRHGVGKTAVVKETFERKGLKWRYYSAATMDPWCDFVGVPRPVKNAQGQDVLDFVLPRDFADDSIEALFFDEFNRSHKKVRDAVMELIQFKSINGRQFHNLKIVWAAINPPDEGGDNKGEYQVDTLDPALIDRFQIHVAVPFKPDPTYFRKQFGAMGSHAVDWWGELDAGVRNRVSPRRLEYALGVYKANGNVSYVLPREANVKQLVDALGQGTLTTIARNLAVQGDLDQAKSWLASANNLTAVLDMMPKEARLRKFFLPILPEEGLALAMAKSKKVTEFVIANETDTTPNFTSVISSILTANQNHKLIKFIRSIRKRPEVVTLEQIVEFPAKVLTAVQTNVRWKEFERMADSMDQFLGSEKDAKKQEEGAHHFLCTAIHILLRTQASTMKTTTKKKLMKRVSTIVNQYMTATARKNAKSQAYKTIAPNAHPKIDGFLKAFNLV